jgi:hypothetical protein
LVEEERRRSSGNEKRIKIDCNGCVIEKAKKFNVYPFFIATVVLDGNLENLQSDEETLAAKLVIGFSPDMHLQHPSMS